MAAEQAFCFERGVDGGELFRTAWRQRRGGRERVAFGVTQRFGVCWLRGAWLGAPAAAWRLARGKQTLYYTPDRPALISSPSLPFAHILATAALACVPLLASATCTMPISPRMASQAFFTPFTRCAAASSSFTRLFSG